LQLIEK